MGMFRSVTFALLAAGCAVNAFAQVQTGELTGIVKSSDGQTVPGATVTVKGAVLQGTRTSVTDQNGAFAVHALPPGSYDAVFELSGFTTRTERVSINVGQTAIANVVLAPAGVTESVNVTASTEETGLASTQIGANYKGDTINTLPTSRTLSGIAELAPGLTNNTPNAGQVTISGGFAYDNLMMINGVDVADNLFGNPNNLFVEDAIAETTVLTSAISAEYGRFSGGVVNAVTKSGGNAFTGSFRANLSNPTWTALTPLEVTRGIKHNSILGKNYEGTFGGPIRKDRVWFFSDGRWQKSTSESPLPVSQINFDSSTKNVRYEGNATATVRPGHTIRGNYINNRSDLVRESLGIAIDPHSAESPSFPNDLAAVSYNGAVRSNLLVALSASVERFGFRKSGGHSTALNDSPIVSLGATPNVVPVSLFNAPYFDSTDPEDRNHRQFAGSVTWYKSGHAGTHDVKGGFEHFTAIRNGGNSQSATNYVLDTDYLATPAGVPILDANGYFIPVFIPGVSVSEHWLAQRGATLHTRTLGLYVQDHWTVGPKLSLDLGTRFEDVRSAATGGIVGINARNIVPRLAGTYDVFGNGRTILQASYAHYAGGYNGAQVGQNTTVGNPAEALFAYTGPAGQGRDFAPGFNPANYTDPQGVTFPTVNVEFAPHLHSPVVRETTVSAGQQIGRVTAKATYTHRRYTGFIEDFIDNPSPSGKVPVTYQGVDYGFADISVFRNSDVPVRVYDGIVLQAGYRPASRFTVDGHWTIELRDNGNFEGEAANQPGLSSLIGDYPQMLEPSRNFPTGRLDDFQRHKVRLWATYSQPLGRFGSVDVAPLVRVNSGLTYSLRAANVALTPQQLALDPGYAGLPGGGLQTLYFGERGSQTFKGYALLDLSATYGVPVFRTARPWVKVEVLNATNNLKQVAWNTTVLPDPNSPKDAFGLPTGYIKGVNFGKATSTAQYPQWRPGNSGGRTFLLSFGARF